jgi:hypothetical protein
MRIIAAWIESRMQKSEIAITDYTLSAYFASFRPFITLTEWRQTCASVASADRHALHARFR